MRIDTLLLDAFGPFTKVRLHFGPSNGALHLVFGENEAGKSSALRALQCFLFGIPHNTADNFVHANADLRIGAKLKLEGGDTFTACRRKGRKNTLRRPEDDKELDDEVIQDALGQIEPDEFQLRFGIDYESLTSGGAAIAAGKGDLAESLFAAAGGMASLIQVQSGLQDSLDAIFRPRGQKPAINAALLRLNQLNASLEETQLSSDKWEQEHGNLKATLQSLDEVEANHKRLTQQKKQLEYRTHLRPLLEQRVKLKERLSELGGAKKIRSDFSAVRIAATESLKNASERFDELTQGMVEIESKLANTRVAEEFIKQREEILALHQEVGVIRSAQQHLRQEAEEARQLHDDVNTLYREWTNSASGELTFPLNRMLDVNAIEPLLRETEATDLRLELIANQLKEIGHESIDSESAIVQTNGALAQKVDLLATIAEECGELLPDASQLKSVRIQLRSQENELNKLLESLPFWDGQLLELMRADVPLEEAVDQFARELQEQTRAVEACHSELKAGEKNLHETKERLAELSKSFDVPSSLELTEVRKLRDALLQQLENAARAGSRIDADAVEQIKEKTANADQLVDQMRLNADQVASRDELESKLDSEEKGLQKATERWDRERTKLTDIQRRWNLVWEAIGVQPGRPDEMRSWLKQRDEIKERFETYEQLGRQFEHLSHRVDEGKASFVQRLQNVEVEFDSSQGVEDLIKETQQRIQEYRIQLEAANSSQAKEQQRRNLAAQADSLKEARRNSAELLCASIAAADDQFASIDPQSMAGSLESVHRFLDSLEKLGRFQLEAERRRKLSDAFSQRVDQLADEVNVRRQDDSPIELVQTIKSRLEDAQSSLAQHEALMKQKEENRKSLEAAARAKGEQLHVLKELCGEVGCEEIDDLERFDQQATEVARLVETLDRLQDQIKQQLQQHGQLSEDEESAALPDSTVDDIFSIDVQLEQLNEQRQQLSEQVGRFRNELERIDGVSHAANVASEVQLTSESIRRHVEEYYRLKLAGFVLRKAIEAYRDRNQGPLLDRASRFFCDLTQNSFVAIRADYDDKARAVLVGVRPDGKTVKVDGMSEGSRDQLYLALRISAMHHYLDHHGQVPIILDDLLIKFDDKRSATALALFADLAKRTQVIYFTHHERIIDLAREVLDDESRHVQRLEPASAGVPKQKKASSAKQQRLAFHDS